MDTNSQHPLVLELKLAHPKSWTQRHDDEQTDNADTCGDASINEWILLASLSMFLMSEDVVEFNVLHEMLKLLNLNFVSHLFHLKLA